MGLFTHTFLLEVLNKVGLIQSNMTCFLPIFKEIWPVIGYICLSDQIKAEQFKRANKM
ncbi:hypothetical protein TUM4445_10000 [Shewanella sp. MBTL60-112-B2]|nr:hypothetical protein TUM4445_10000 [Shewanella sp. MBTL60-112-B2]